MSAEGLEAAVKQLMIDRELRFREQVDSGNALQRFDLTEDEREAISKRDQFRLEELGLEPWTARWVSGLR